MGDLPGGDVPDFSSLHLLADVAGLDDKELAELEEKLEKEKVIMNEKLKGKQVLVLEHEEYTFKKGGSGEDFRKGFEGFSSDEQESWDGSMNHVQESLFDGSGEGCSKWGEDFDSIENDFREISMNEVQESMFDGSGEGCSKWAEGFNSMFDGSGEGCSKWAEGFNSKEKKSWNVSNKKVEESKRKKRKSWTEGCSKNDKKQSREKKKPLKNVVQLPSPEIPVAFKTAISDLLNGGTEFTGEIMLVLEKKLHMSDLARNQNRLSLPENKINRMNFLNSNEESYLRQVKPNGKYAEIVVNIIEPLLMVPGTVDLRFWPSNSQYSLTGKWHALTLRNQLEEGDFVQLWAFRIAGELCFALNTVPSRKEPKKEQKDKKKKK